LQLRNRLQPLGTGKPDRAQQQREPRPCNPRPDAWRARAQCVVGGAAGAAAAGAAGRA
jgi:hypothetical protein